MSEESKIIKPKPIFPDIQYERKIGGIELTTYVRILRNGEYYTLLFKETIQFPLGEIADPSYAAQCYQRLIRSVYTSIHLYNFPQWKVPDVDQTPEEERLEEKYQFHLTKPNL